MSEAKTKSRTFRRIKKRVVSGTVTHYTKRKPAKCKCANCSVPLKGVKSDLPSKIQKLSKSERRPERPFGGVLCSQCARKEHKKSARVEK